MIKAIIFDLDGVICSTDEYHYQAWKSLADSIGVYFDREINNRLRGVSRMTSLDIILERSAFKFSTSEKLSMAETKNEIYKKLLKQMSPADLSDEVNNTLLELMKRSLKLAIGSSSKNAKAILERIGIINYFDVISDGTNIIRSKPDPEVFTAAAEMLGLEPCDCLVVEDAIAGVEAAIIGGFLCAGINDAAHHPKCNFKLHTFEDVLMVIDNI